MTSSNTESSLLPAVIAGLIGGLISTLTAISYSTLVFSGELMLFASLGIALSVFSAMVLSAVVAAMSSFAGMVAIPQPRIAPLSLLIVMAASSQYGAKDDIYQFFLTVVASLCIASLLTGLVLLLLGIFKAGRFVRFVPYPVVGGFLAGAGWLLVAGAYQVMTARPFGLEPLDSRFNSDGLVVLVPGAILALALVMLLRRKAHYLATPGVLMGSIALFYLVLVASGHDSDFAAQQGLLLGPLPDSDGWAFVTHEALSGADWGLLLEQAGVFGTIVLVATLSLLLHASSIELTSKTDIDLNREMQAAGVANMVSGMGSGIIGFHAVGPTVLGMQLGKRSRWTGYTAAVFPAIVLLIGIDAMSYLPRFVVGALLLFLGLSFLAEWVWDGFRKLSRADYAVVLIILLTVGWAGYLEGIAVGMIAALGLFVVNYSRINVVRQALTGAVLQSNVDRPEELRRTLVKEGERTLIFKLQGFVFFGTANGLLVQFRKYLDDPQSPDPRFLILDFRAVTGFDSSAGISFVKLSQLAEKHDFTVVLADASAETLRVLKRGGLMLPTSRCVIEPDMDHALEACEEQVLTLVTGLNYRAETGFEDLVRSTGINTGQSEILLDHMVRLDLPAGQVFIEAGSHADSLYFLEEGLVSVTIELNDGSVIRVRTMGSGTIIGEIGLYLGQTRTASVITDVPCVLLKLSEESLVDLEANHPDVAVAFHRHMTAQVGRQLVQTKMAFERIS